MMFELNKTYRMNLENLDNDFGTWFRLSREIMGDDFLKDGRILGRVLENTLCSVFENLELNEDSSYDIRMGDLKLEVKSSTSANGMNFQPSNMIGASRTYDYDLHKKKTEEIDYYIAIDRSNLPIIEVFVIPSDINNVSLMNRNGNMKGSFTANEWKKHKELFRKELQEI